LDAYRKHIESTGKPLFALGPLLPDGYGKTKISADSEAEVEEFLADKLEKCGPDSVLFVSSPRFHVKLQTINIWYLRCPLVLFFGLQLKSTLTTSSDPSWSPVFHL
jgi:hypothetical protein